MSQERRRRSLYFVRPGEVAVREEPMPQLAPYQALVKTTLSAISSGTELLIYRGQAPAALPADATIAALAGDLSMPLKYGYSSIGRVVAVGRESCMSWVGRLVFAFHPHETHFVVSVDELMPVPSSIAVEDAVFLPNMETAVNFIMDGRPMIGEQVVVFGQGIVGLLTTALLARCPLGSLVTLDRHQLRRQASLGLGAGASLDPEAPGVTSLVRASLADGQPPGGADLAFELSGVPDALDQALAVTGYSGRVVIGSWYGTKRAELDLGGAFHRSRIRLVASQVSTIDPGLTGRWNKQRRFALAWRLLRQVAPSRFITHSFPLERAAEAYRLLDERPGEVIQAVLTS